LTFVLKRGILKARDCGKHLSQTPREYSGIAWKILSAILFDKISRPLHSFIEIIGIDAWVKSSRGVTVGGIQKNAYLERIPGFADKIDRFSLSNFI